MNRLYQWLHERATSIRSVTFDSQGRRFLTEVTVQQEERTTLLSSMGPGICPLCGHRPVPGATTASAQHDSIVQGSCPEHGRIDKAGKPHRRRQGDSDETSRRLDGSSDAFVT